MLAKFSDALSGKMDLPPVPAAVIAQQPVATKVPIGPVKSLVAPAVMTTATPSIAQAGADIESLANALKEAFPSTMLAPLAPTAAPSFTPSISSEKEAFKNNLVSRAIEHAKERQAKLDHPFRLNAFSDNANELFKTIQGSVELPKDMVAQKET